MTSQPLVNEKVVINRLKDNLKNRKPCDVWNSDPTDAKYIGICALCDLYCCNNCLYAGTTMTKNIVKDKKSEKKPKKNDANKIHSVLDKICSWCFGKLIIHYSISSLLRDHNMEDINLLNSTLSKLRNEHLTMWHEYGEILDMYEFLWQTDKNTRKEHRNALDKLGQIQKEHRQLIENEERLTKDFRQELNMSDHSDPLQREYEQLISEQKELEYEINKNIGDMRTQEIELENLKLTNASYSKSISQLEAYRKSKLNKTCDIENDSLRYEYKEKSFDGIRGKLQDGEYEQKYRDGKYDENDPFFRASDVNLTSTSRVTTTRHDTSNNVSKLSGTFNMMDSFAQKTLIDEEEDQYEDSTSYLHKDKTVKFKQRNKQMGNMCGNSCVIF